MANLEVSISESSKQRVMEFMREVAQGESPLGVASLVIGSMLAIINANVGHEGAQQVMDMFAARSHELLSARSEVAS